MNQSRRIEDISTRDRVIAAAISVGVEVLPAGRVYIIPVSQIDVRGGAEMRIRDERRPQTPIPPCAVLWLTNT